MDLVRSNFFQNPSAGLETRDKEELGDLGQRHERDADKKAQVAADFRDQLDRRLFLANRPNGFVVGLKGQRDPGFAAGFLTAIPIQNCDRIYAERRKRGTLRTVAVAINGFGAVHRPVGTQVGAVAVFDGYIKHRFNRIPFC